MSDLVIIKSDSPAAIANRERPTIVLPGGGKRIRLLNGREVVIGGEALRIALQKKIVRFPNGQEVEVSHASMLRGRSQLQRALDQGAKIVKEVEIIGDEPMNLKRGPSVPEQQNEALRQENNQRLADSLGPSEGAIGVGGGKAVVKAGGGNAWAGAHFVK